jgi:hypothetical protein
MATFNTAFGSLPSPEQQLYGNKGASAALGGPKAAGAKPKSAPIMGGTQNFADMQKQGIARPAPVTTAPVLGEPTLAQRLAQQLNIPAENVAPNALGGIDFSGAPSSFSYQGGETPPQGAAPPTGASFLDKVQAQVAPLKSDGDWDKGTDDKVSRPVVTPIPTPTPTGTGTPRVTNPIQTLPPTTTPTVVATTRPPVTTRKPTDTTVNIPTLTVAVTKAVTLPGTAIPTGDSVTYKAPPPLSGLPNIDELRKSIPDFEKYMGSEQAMALRKMLEEQLGVIAKGPAEIQNQAYEAARAAKSADLSAQYGAERSKLEEELAARGLSASSIGGGRYGDLAGQQARAIASFEAELMQQQADAEAKNRQLYLTTMSDLAGLAGTQDLGTFQANTQAQQAQADIEFRAAELQQEAAIQGRSLNLQQARDEATAQYQNGQLRQGYAEISSRENIARANMTQEQNRLAIESGLSLYEIQVKAEQIKADARLRGIEIDDKKAYDDAQLDLRNREADEAARSNKASELIASGTLSINQGNFLQGLAEKIGSGAVDAEDWDMLVRQSGMDPDALRRLGYKAPTKK